MQEDRNNPGPCLPQPEFIPTSQAEAEKIGWRQLDIAIISGEAYADHPSFGVALIARILVSSGFKVGIIPQPDWRNPGSVRIFGRPRLCFAISSGNLDSTLRTYTAARRTRKSDDYSEDGRTGLFPPAADVVYANLARQAYPGVKVVLGGVEASLRRIAHYDYWQDKIRPSILADSKADILVYGMAEKSIVEVAARISKGRELSGIRGTARLAGGRESRFLDSSKYRMLPSYDEIVSAPDKLLESFQIAEDEANPFNARPLLQRHGDRFLIVEAPQEPLTRGELDAIYALPFAYAKDPRYKGTIPAFEMIKNSITSLRGCPGGCSFCTLALHQGRFIQSRSAESIVREIRRLASKPHFRGTISDIGGPTANCYGSAQALSGKCRACRRPSCLFPSICPEFHIDDAKFAELLEKASSQENVKHAFVGSGIRTDIALRQPKTTCAIISGHVSGQLKIAPEHLDDDVLRLMRKNKAKDFFDFVRIFEKESERAGKKQYLVPYFISNFPGSGEREFRKVDEFLRNSQWRLQQVQDFIPLPMTIASAIYLCGRTVDGRKIHVNRGLKERREQLAKLKGGEHRT